MDTTRLVFCKFPPGSEGDGAPDTAPAAAAEAEVDMSMFDLSKKKKKKKKKVKTEGEDEEGGRDGEDREEGEGRYNYETLLERIQVYDELLCSAVRNSSSDTVLAPPTAAPSSLVLCLLVSLFLSLCHIKQSTDFA